HEEIGIREGELIPARGCLQAGRPGYVALAVFFGLLTAFWGWLLWRPSLSQPAIGELFGGAFWLGCREVATILFRCGGGRRLAVLASGFFGGRPRRLDDRQKSPRYGMANGAYSRIGSPPALRVARNP